MICRPASQFCCGCSVKCGVTFILLLHLLECLCVTIMTIVFMIGKDANVFLHPFSDLGVQSAFAIFALAGIPIILVALHSIRCPIKHMEASLRLYLFYMIAAFLLNLVHAMHLFVFHHTCDELPNVMAMQGRAWACGVARVSDIGALMLMVVIPGYLIWIVYSYCEDMTEGGSGPDLSDLTSIGKHHRQPLNSSDPYSSVLGLNGCADQYGTYPGLGGGQPILDGTYHEMAYPAPATTAHHWKR